MPGAKPDARNEPVPFTAPQLPTTLHPHPLNPEQTPVLVGTIPDFSPPGLGWLSLPWSGPGERGDYWCVALSHLAHGREECERCAPVWDRADAHWARMPDDDGRAILFVAIGLSHRQNDRSNVRLLIPSMTCPTTGSTSECPWCSPAVLRAPHQVQPQRAHRTRGATKPPLRHAAHATRRHRQNPRPHTLFTTPDSPDC